MDLWINWISPAALWRQLRRDQFEQLLVATAMGIGTFMAAIPLGGWQVLLAAYASRRLRVHLIPAILGSLLCIAPVGHTLSRIAIGIGHFLCHLRLPEWTVFDPAAVDHWTLLGRLPLAWPIGAIITGFFANWITIVVFVRVFRLIPVEHEEGAG